MTHFESNQSNLPHLLDLFLQIVVHSFSAPELELELKIEDDEPIKTTTALSLVHLPSFL